MMVMIWYGLLCIIFPPFRPSLRLPREYCVVVVYVCEVWFFAQSKVKTQTTTFRTTQGKLINDKCEFVGEGLGIF